MIQSEENNKLNNNMIQRKINTVKPRYVELAYLELALISKWKSAPCFNMKLWQQNKIMWKRGEIAPKSNFSSFPHYFIYF